MNLTAWWHTLVALDARLSARLRVAEKPGALRRLAAGLAHSGDSWFWGLGLALVWGLGDAGAKAWALKLVGAIAVTAVVVQIAKWLVRRRRPAGEWGGLYRRTDPLSFPSGHAARMAMLVAAAAAWGPSWLAGLLGVWAPLVALARVMMGVHYLSDVIAGAVLGLGIGWGLGRGF